MYEWARALGANFQWMAAVNVAGVPLMAAREGVPSRKDLKQTFGIGRRDADEIKARIMATLEEVRDTNLETDCFMESDILGYRVAITVWIEGVTTPRLDLAQPENVQDLLDQIENDAEAACFG